MLAPLEMKSSRFFQNAIMWTQNKLGLYLNTYQLKFILKEQSHEIVACLYYKEDTRCSLHMSVLLNITVSFVMILVRMFRKCERYFILKYCKSKGQHETWSSLFYLFLTLHPQTGLRDVGAEVLFANRLARCRYTVYRYTVHNENL